MKTRCLCVTFAVVLLFPMASAQWSQQGSKLVATGTVGSATQGPAVSLSADGNTAIIAGPTDNNGNGGMWMFTRSGGVWKQVGGKVFAADNFGNMHEGVSVALSADGLKAIIGGYDDTGAGAAWVFRRSDTVWIEQGGRLVRASSPSAWQGCSVALSVDGTTALVGGNGDNSGTGAAWVFTWSAGSWTPTAGTKLVGTGAVGNAGQGYSVALSLDGNTAALGGPDDSSNAGAAWIFTRSGGVWSQQGRKLVGTGAIGNAEQGYSVALSANGDTILVGGLADHSGIGAAWVFTRSGGKWTQQGNKLVGTGAVGSAYQGYSVGLSADGRTAILGGAYDNGSAGAAWIFAWSGSAWTQQGTKLVGSGAVGSANQGYSVALSGDGTTAIVGGPYDNGQAGASWVFTKPATGVSTDFSHEADPQTFRMGQNYPNPFNPATTISYALPRQAHVILTVYNALGQKVAELVNAEKEAGSYLVKFNANGLASGVYFYRIQAGSFVETKKLILLR